MGILQYRIPLKWRSLLHKITPLYHFYTQVKGTCKPLAIEFLYVGDFITISLKYYLTLLGSLKSFHRHKNI